MKNWNLSACYLVILLGLVILIIVGGCITNSTSSQTSDATTAGKTSPTTTTTHPASPPESPSSSTQNSGSECNTESRINIPVDTSVPIKDPIPGIRYSFNRSETGRTIILEKGDIVEINLGYAPSQPFHWIVKGSGCGIELLNVGTFSSGGDYWNNTGIYRARYRAITPGTSFLDGKLVLTSEESGMLTFNLTVIVK
jgi:hypothetical protein